MGVVRKDEFILQEVYQNRLQVLDSELHVDVEGEFAHWNLSDYLSSKPDSFVAGKIKFTLKQPKLHILDDA